MDANEFFISAQGVRMPLIIYGTAWKKERTAQLVEQAITLGFRGIDTACQPKHYNEAGVGEGVAAACLKLGLDRSQLYLQTKFTPLDGQDPLRLPYDPKANLAEQVSQSFQTSLQNLATAYLDCLVLHSPLASRKQLLEVWQAMEKICHSGGAKQLGISNCYDPELFDWLYRTAEVKPAVIQNRFYADTGYDRSIREFCRSHEIVYESFWTLTANPTVLAHATLLDLAAKYQCSAAQAFFRYLSQIGIVPLTGTTSAAHMRDDLAIFDFELTDDECIAVNDLL